MRTNETLAGLINLNIFMELKDKNSFLQLQSKTHFRDSPKIVKNNCLIEGTVWLLNF